MQRKNLSMTSQQVTIQQTPHIDFGVCCSIPQPIYHHPSHITAIVNLTLAICNSPPSPQALNVLSYHLWINWQDINGYYHTYRTLASRASANTLTNAQRWINFTLFSATLLDQSNDEVFVREIGIHAFFDLKKALEIALDTYARETLRHNSVVTAEQVMEIDVVAAAQWVIFAGDKLLDLDNAILGRNGGED